METTCPTTLLHIPGDMNPQQDHYDNLKSRILDGYSVVYCNGYQYTKYFTL